MNIDIIGHSPSGKAGDFDSSTRWFESNMPSYADMAKWQTHQSQKLTVINHTSSSLVIRIVFYTKQKRSRYITKQNKYKIEDKYVIGFTDRRNNEFYFDLDDFELVKQYYWVIDSSKNVICKNMSDHQISMHKLIMGDGIYIHKNGNNFDNRKENLILKKGYKNNGITYLNGYIAIYLPEHKRAFDNGCVYEHILIAEKMLNRELKPEECVHHIDKNRTNNSESNLMVFATNNDHISFHNGANAYMQSDGSYKCETENENVIYKYINRTKKDINNNIDDTGSIRIIKKKIKCDLCPVCKINYKTPKAKMCLECAKKQQAKNIPPKEVLSEYIYKYSFKKIGLMFGVSDSAVKKWCRKYGLPSTKREINKINNSNKVA